MNNTAGQALLARRMGNTRINAETGSGQHDLAVVAANDWARWKSPKEMPGVNMSGRGDR